MNKLLMWLLIPKGVYCDGCPFHFRDWSRPEQENGYCSYLGKSDWDLNEERGDIDWHDGDGNVTRTAPHEMPMSLLWGGCKECGVKER